MARTHKQMIKQIEMAKTYAIPNGNYLNIFDYETMRDQFPNSIFGLVLTAYNLGYLRGEAAQAKRKPR